MRIYRQRYKNGPDTKKTKNYYIGITDHLGNYQRIPAFLDKSASQSFGYLLEQLVIARKSLIPPSDSVIAQVDKLPITFKQRLMKIGLFEGNPAITIKSLDEHLKDWQGVLTGRKLSASYISQAPARIQRICQDCNFQEIRELKSSRIRQWLSQMKADGLSGETLNRYIATIKAFCTWLVDEGRGLVNSPVDNLSLYNPKLDNARQRRPLEVTEQKQLLQAALSGAFVQGMTGKDRQMLYLVALETGLRWGELHSLSVDSFKLDDDPPRLVLEAKHSKHRQQDLVPLRTSTAAELKLYFAGRSPDDQAFTGMWAKRGADMLRVDLEAAGIPYETKDGVCDFHSLRHTFLSTLAEQGVHPKVAQTLGRHSTITLTMDRYTHTALGSLMKALDKLPDLSVG